MEDADAFNLAQIGVDAEFTRSDASHGIHVVDLAGNIYCNTVVATRVADRAGEDGPHAITAVAQVVAVQAATEYARRVCKTHDQGPLACLCAHRYQRAVNAPISAINDDE